MDVVRRTSLRRRLYASFLIVFVYVLLVISASVTFNYSLRNRFSTMMDQNELFAELLFVQSEVQSGFSEALRGESETVLHRFRTAQDKMTTLLSQVAESDMLSRAGKTHFRIVRNMYDYQAVSSARLVERLRLTPNDYIEISFLARLYGQMNEQAQELAVVEYRANSQRFALEYHRTQRIENIALVILGIFVLVFGGLAIRSINQLIHSTHALIAASSEFTDGSLQEQLETTGFVELDAIGGAFQTMQSEIRRSMDELKEKSKLEIELQREHLENERKDRLLKQAQLDFLRSQINPHFLFNTLNIIGKATVLEDAEKSLELIEAISLILRYTLEHNESLVPLNDELEIVRAYLFIQRARFTSRLTYEVRIDDQVDVDAVRVPSVILQPLVENAIKYGLEQHGQVLTITVEVSSAEDGVRLTVRDDGPGPESNLNALVPSMGIGLQNLRQRLELRFGRTDLITYGSASKGGVEVQIVIPQGTGERA